MAEDNENAAFEQAKKRILTSSNARELSKRFRIDHLTKQVNLLIERKFGSSPIIVITPDGTKWYFNRHPKNVTWMDGLTGDMIKITDPVAGPYQLVGRMVKGSMIQQASDLDIYIEPLPQPLFQYERLKTHAHFLGDDKLVRMPGLDFLIEWRARFLSTVENDSTMATADVTIGRYTDNGEYLDEIPDDGVFTGTLNLNQQPGEYVFSVTAKNKVFTRNAKTSVTLLASPVTINVLKPSDPVNGKWKLQISIDDNKIYASKTQIELELYGPNNIGSDILLNKIVPGTSETYLTNMKDYGTYRVSGSIVSTTREGREIILALPEIYFNKLMPGTAPPSQKELDAKAAAEAAIAKTQAEKKAQLTAIIINVSLLVLGVMILLIWQKMKAKAREKRLAEQKAKEEELARLAEAEKEDPFDHIDLTMPETEEVPANETDKS